MRVRAALRTLLVALAALIVVLPHVEAYRLQANLAPPALIGATGNVTSDPERTTDFLVDGSRLAPSSTRPIFEAPNASLQVIEFRWRSIDRGGPGGALRTSTENMSTWEQRHVSLRDARVFLEGVRPGATFGGRVHGGEFTGTVDAGPDLDCQIATPRLSHLIEARRSSPSRSALQALSGLLPGLGVFEASTDAPSLTAACEGRSLRAVQNSSVWAFDVALRFDYEDPDAGVPSTLRVETGRFVGAPDAQGVAEGVWRMVWLSTWEPRTANADADPYFLLEGPMRIELRSPAFLLGARLDLPASKGALRWGDLIESDPAMNRTPGGAFLVRAISEESVWIDGESIDAPPTVARPSPGPQPSPLGVTMAVLGAAVAALGAAWRFRHILAALGTRLTREKALRNPLRRAILDLVRTRPGVRLHEVVAQLRGTRGATEHHVQALRLLGLVWTQRVGVQTQLFPARPPDPRQAVVDELLRRPTHERILGRIRRDPRQSQDVIARAIGISQSYVSRVMRQLADAGVVRIVVSGRRREYRVTENGQTTR